MFFIFLIIILLFIFICFRKTKFDFYKENEKENQPLFPEKTLTAGNWGHFEPRFCYQEKPSKNALDSFDKDMPTCNACHMMCSSHSAWERCQKCLKEF